LIDEEKTGFSWGRDLSYNLILALLYFLGGKFSFSFFYQDKIVTLTAFLPEGFALAAVLIYGPRILPGIVLGQFALALDAGLQLIPALGVALVNGIEALLAAFLARYLHFDIQLRRVRDILILTVLIFFVLQPFSSLLGNGVLYLAHETHNHYFHADLFYWWFGNSMGQILLTPLLLTLYTWHPRPNYLLLGLIATATVLLNYLLQILLGVHNLCLLIHISEPTRPY
jgi:integral membrane sensor domain MASE1